MATRAPIMGAPTCAPSNVIPFPGQPHAALRAKEVPEFDPRNPLHRAAWAALCRFAAATVRS